MLRLLREARRAAGLTQAEVARSFGRTQGFISKIESGEIRLDPIELQRLAELYGVEVGVLLPGGRASSDNRMTTGANKGLERTRS
jgi:transcriptional regulator with XRE-family HTH domain